MWVHFVGVFKYVSPFFSPRVLGEHGFLVEGSLTACKKQATLKSIPYKYVVYKAKKGKYDFEFIYKQDSTEFTNRCLFVKTTLLDSNGNQSFTLSGCIYHILPLI